MALGLLTIQIAETQPELILSTADWHGSPEDVLIHTTNNTAPFPDDGVMYYEIPDNFYDANNTLYVTYVDCMQDDIGIMVLVDVDVDIQNNSEPIPGPFDIDQYGQWVRANYTCSPEIQCWSYTIQNITH